MFTVYSVIPLIPRMAKSIDRKKNDGCQGLGGRGGMGSERSTATQFQSRVLEIDGTGHTTVGHLQMVKMVNFIFCMFTPIFFKNNKKKISSFPSSSILLFTLSH